MCVGAPPVDVAVTATVEPAGFAAGAVAETVVAAAWADAARPTPAVNTAVAATSPPLVRRRTPDPSGFLIMLFPSRTWPTRCRPRFSCTA